jgi:hypothetical protein
MEKINIKYLCDFLEAKAMCSKRSCDKCFKLYGYNICDITDHFVLNARKDVMRLVAILRKITEKQQEMSEEEFESFLIGELYENN